MSSGAKFNLKRFHAQGEMTVQTGFRRDELSIRILSPNDGRGPISLTYQQASDLADALDDALDQQDEDPLL